MSAHIEESAALYALGALDERERAAIDAHVESCALCARALAQACDDVAAMAQAQPQHLPPAALRARTIPRRRWNLPVAAAAAVVLIALAPIAALVQQNRAMHATELAEAALMARMTSSPHRMVAFTGMTKADAKVVYGADGSWYGVVVRGATAPLRLVWMHDGRKTSLGMVEQHGDVATIYLPKSHRMDRLALSDGREVVAEANLVF